jgi:FAD/FMN-containing dehydrogenase
MTDLRVASVDGGETIVEGTAVKELKNSLRGPLLSPSEGSYDEARKVWNGMIDRRPALIARCAGVADVIAAVRFARAHRVLASVRGGGHNAPGNAVCDGGLMIDLGGMNSIRVDPVSRTARAEGGTTWANFDRETQVFALATTGGAISSTGIAGLTLGGGLGWLAGKFGLSCDNLLSVDLITAEGELRTVSAAENDDLFWGVRGGGGNFGVVTSFEYRLHPVGPVVGGVVLYPFSRAREALTFYRDFSTTAPDELNTVGVLITLPDGAPAVAILVCYNGDLETEEKVLRPLRTFGPPLVDRVALMPYRQVQTLLDASTVRGRRNYVKTIMMRTISDGAIDLMVERFATVPSPLSSTFFQQLGNAASRVDATATAFSHRGVLCEWNCRATWLDPTEDRRNVAWARELAEAMVPHSTGGEYVNHLGLEADEGSERIRAAFGVNYQRLVALKNKYDPTNLFRHNQNIKPRA